MDKWWNIPATADAEYDEYDYFYTELPHDYVGWEFDKYKRICDTCGKESHLLQRSEHYFYTLDGYDSCDYSTCWKCMIEDKIWSVKHKIKKRIKIIKTTFELYNMQSKRNIKRCYELALKLHRQHYKINVEKKKRMIKIKQAIEKPVEDDNHWSYPVSELDYLLEEKEDGATFLLYDGRLYETDKNV